MNSPNHVMEFPPAFKHRILSQLEQANLMLNALSNPPATSIRLHPTKGNANYLEIENNINWCKDAFYLKQRPVFTLDPLFHAGAYYVQESSSMFVWHVLEQIFDERNIRLLDLCAAPGGKSTLMASWLHGEGLLVCNEVIKNRAQILLENITKWGYANTWVTSTDAYVLGGLENFFDAIMLDAPCSGEGLFRKDKAAIAQWSEANCELCAGRQKKIVAEILPALQIGGYLIYSTCTFNPAENDENIQWLLHEFPLEVVPIDITNFAEICPTDMGGYAFYPHLTRGEGFYCCVLKKTGDIGANTGIRKQKLKLETFNPKLLPISKYVKNAGDYYWFTTHQRIAGVPLEYVRDFETITEITKVLGGYLVLGEIKGKDLVPDHSLAMSLDIGNPFPQTEVDKEQALAFLARKVFKLLANTMGWNTLTYQNQPLGFIKQMPNRFNNYYPPEWRIRMDV
jgi:16S rRNA C967 or C1407 C5-methylase (RsmB/RsmF family)/NOL1/NOP2/fmu family ribosome biogenesis protein